MDLPKATNQCRAIRGCTREQRLPVTLEKAAKGAVVTIWRTVLCCTQPIRFNSLTLQRSVTQATPQDPKTKQNEKKKGQLQ